MVPIWALNPSQIVFVDLFAFVIANLIQTYIAFNGYYKNKKYKWLLIWFLIFKYTLMFKI